MTQVDTLPSVDTFMSMSKLKKSKETTSKKNSTGKKRTSRVGDISFSTSFDDSDHMTKKRKISDDRIPDTQTMVRQLKKLDLSPSQMEHVLRANRKGSKGKAGCHYIGRPINMHEVVHIMKSVAAQKMRF